MFCFTFHDHGQILVIDPCQGDRLSGNQRFKIGLQVLLPDKVAHFMVKAENNDLEPVQTVEVTFDLWDELS